MKRFNLLAGILSDALLIACGMLAAVCTAPSAFRIPFETATPSTGGEARSAATSAPAPSRQGIPATSARKGMPYAPVSGFLFAAA